MKKKLGMLILSVSLLSSALTGCTIGDTEFVLDVTPIGRSDIFSVNGVQCSKEEAKLYLCNYQNLYGKEYGVDLWDYDYSKMDKNKTLAAYVKDVTLAELANVMCMSQLAKEQGVTLTKKEQERLEKVVNEYYDSLSEAEISYMGIDKDELKKYYEKYALAHKLYTYLNEGINEEVSDDEARVMQTQQIYVKDPEKAQTVKEKLDAGEDFATVASKHNEAESVERYLTRGEFSAEADAILFRLDNKEMSGMIKGEDGYYFIKCVNKYVADLTELHKEEIVVQRRKEKFDNALGDFIKNAEFAINEKRWDEIKVDTSGEIKTDSFFAIYDKYFVEN